MVYGRSSAVAAFAVRLCSVAGLAVLIDAVEVLQRADRLHMAPARADLFTTEIPAALHFSRLSVITSSLNDQYAQRMNGAPLSHLNRPMSRDDPSIDAELDEEELDEFMKCEWGGLALVLLRRRNRRAVAS